MADGEVKHDYHLVDPSPWPLIGSISAFIMAVGFIMTIKGRQGLKWGLWLTIGLGMLFTTVQAYEYAHATFGFKGSIYGATFFMATGFHGAHVIIGTIFLAVCLWRAYQGHFTPRHHLGFE